MTRPKNTPDNVIPFPVEGLRKFGFERASKRRMSPMEQAGQLHLFERPAGEVLQLPTGIAPFDEALLLDERGETAAAERYRKAVAEGDRVADAYCNLGIMESKKGRTAEAFDCFTRSLAQEPRHFESHYNIANLYSEVGDLRLARTHYEMAAAVEPDFPNVYFNLGLVQAMAENYEPAIEALATYQKLSPSSERRMADELLAMLRRSVSGRR